MADLEDTILKQNIPGRWSTFERGENLGHEYCDHSDDECDINATTRGGNSEGPKNEEEALMNLARNMAYDDVPEPIRQSIIAQRLRNPSTGVKGVLADYRADQALASAQRQAQVNYRDAVLHRIAHGATAVVVEQDDEDDEAFFAEFRLKRLQELKASTALPQFGKVIDIHSHAEFLAEVDNADPRTKVLVHLYEPTITSCVKVNKYLENISSKYTTIKILRMNASLHSIKIDIIAFPMITIYSQSGEVDRVLGGIEQELGNRFNQEDLEWLLQENEVFATNS